MFKNTSHPQSLYFAFRRCSFPHTQYISSIRSLEKNNVSHIPRQVAGTPRLPSPLCKEHGVSAFLRRTAFFHSSTRVVQQGLVRRAIRPEYQDGIHSSIRFVQQIHNDEGRPRERSDRGRLFAFRQKSLFLAGRTSVGCQILKLRSFFCTSYVCLSVSLSV